MRIIDKVLKEYFEITIPLLFKHGKANFSTEKPI